LEQISKQNEMDSIYTTIISTEDLAKHTADPNWAIVDCRFDLAKPDWGFASYQEAHLPGAVYAHLNQDLSGPVTLETGRHPLPQVSMITQRLEGWGIGDQTQVIVYDTNGGAFAVRLWWQLRFLGHMAVAVLDGGFPKWQREDRPVVFGVESRPAAHFTPHPNPSLVASADEVEQIRQDAKYCLVDARAPERFRGEREPIDPIAGHIPGAVNRFHGDNLNQAGTFLPPATLRSQFQELIGSTPPGRVVVYCGSGVTSIHHILAMELAGLPGARLYAGSWSEWIRGGKRPIS
jgi:thiosulfate/3-mercaptopyruvate sulfurtransferase